MPSKVSRLAVTSPGGGVRPRMARPVCDLPEPDSPTMPRRSRPREKETPRTASTDAGAEVKANPQIFDLEKRLRHLRGLRVEDVAQAVAEQVEAEADDEDGDARASRRPTIGR